MPHFKDLQNKLHFLDNESDIKILPAGSVKITDAEAAILRAPPPLTKEQENAPLIAKLAEIDAKAIRGLLEYVASKPDASQFTKDLAAQAVEERAKLKK